MHRPGQEPEQTTVLVVDDEPIVLRSTERVLTRLGYQVLTAATGAAAVETVRQARSRVSLIVLDMTMPQMSGAQTLEEVRAFAPEVRVLLVSGYSQQGQVERLLDRGCNGFLQKPYSALELSRKVQSLLS